MPVFVINEWLWADSSGNNGPQAQSTAYEVIIKLAASDHQIVVIEGSPFDQKAWKLCKGPSPMIVQRIASAFVGNVRQNSDRCLILKPEFAVALPAELASTTNADDHYLVQCQLSVPGAILVTTDKNLCEAVSKAGLACESREAFLAKYILNG